MTLLALSRRVPVHVFLYSLSKWLLIDFQLDYDMNSSLSSVHQLKVCSCRVARATSGFNPHCHISLTYMFAAIIGTPVHSLLLCLNVYVRLTST
jgi:hypothetical protein